MKSDEPDDFSGVSEHAGFPNAATDSSLTSLDLGKLLIKNPAGTFFMRTRGDSGEKFGIFAGDTVIIDRSLNPRNSDLVVWWSNEEFVIGRLKQVPDEVIVWGVITRIIHCLRKFNEK